MTISVVLEALGWSSLSVLGPSLRDMLISGRDARFLLEAAGFSARHARTALANGLAGEPVRTHAVHLYDEAHVRDLADRPVVDKSRLGRVCPGGFFVARRSLDLTRSHDDLVEQASSEWDAVSPWSWVALDLRVRHDGSLPFLATVAGVVVLGADIVGTRRGWGLDLATPGPWFDDLLGARLDLGPGRPWVLQLGPLSRRDPRCARQHLPRSRHVRASSSRRSLSRCTPPGARR